MFTIQVQRVSSSKRVAPCYCCGVVTVHRSTLVTNALGQVSGIKPLVVPHCTECWNDATYFMADRCAPCGGTGFESGDSKGAVCLLCKGRGVP